MATLVALDTATMTIRRYVGGGAMPVLTHAGALIGEASDFARVIEDFRTRPPEALRIAARGRFAPPTDAA